MFECVPTARADVVYVAVPPESVPVPSVVAPSLNVIVPVAAVGITLAVKLTDAPNAKVLLRALDETVVIVVT
jgi:hypothetical protein